ncbi:hypothetical protein B0H11DRAFT_1803498 [Mycena galericulata]|nr:hypothetical protein B0H11DRAFT_1803498 [Mycena galericulata]
MQDLESEAGLPPSHKSTKESVLGRFASAVSGVLSPHGTTSRHRDANSAASRSTTEQVNHNEAENEEACAKLWSTYVGEAERYDAALVESWRADMEGMLIFSGLFSASLTAFLIESYGNLQPDSGDLTVAAISQVSQQLAAIASGETFVLEVPAPFNPTLESLLCNALWFISLSLSLTCALLATLVEQWAREFLHKTEMRPSPARRARIFSFLYFGLKQFRMQTVVDAIPFLLHASLLLFFAGLIAFLLPVNRIIMYLMCIALLLFLLLYAALTVLPLVYLDSPYRTPLSAPLWSLFHNTFIFIHRDLSQKLTMTEAVVDSALWDTQERDQRALQWTLDSLTDDTELLPFVEAIPDVIHGPNGFRRVNDHFFIPMLGDIETASPLVTRISNLILGTQGLPEDLPIVARRRAAGLKALWALSMMPSSWGRRFNFNIPILPMDNTEFPTTFLALRYHDERWMHHLVRKLCDLLTNPDRSSAHFSDEVIPEIRRLLGLVAAQEGFFVRPPTNGLFPTANKSSSESFEQLRALSAEIATSTPTASQLDRAQHIMRNLDDSFDWASRTIVHVANFLQTAMIATEHHTTLFEPATTCHAILSEIDLDPPRHPVKHVAFDFPPAMHQFKFTVHPPTQLDALAQIAFRLSSFLPSSDRVPYYQPYLVQRGNVEAIQYALRGCDKRQLLRSLSDALSKELSQSSQNYYAVDQISHAFTAVVNCVQSDSWACELLDEALDDRLKELLHPYSAIRAIRHLFVLRELETEAEDMELSGVPAILPRLQEMCHHDMLRPLSPLFLPSDVDARMAIDSLRAHLFDKHLLFLANFLHGLVFPTSARMAISVFKDFGYGGWWFGVDAEIQNTLFEAVRAHTDELANMRGNSDLHYLAAISKELWSSQLFWFFSWDDSRRSPNILWIERPCLQLLRETLKIYHATAETQSQDGVSIDTATSKKLLVLVEKRLEAPATTLVASETGETGAGNIDDAGDGRPEDGLLVEGQSEPTPTPSADTKQEGFDPPDTGVPSPDADALPTPSPLP